MSDKWETFLNVKQSIAIQLLNYMKYAQNQMELNVKNTY